MLKAICSTVKPEHHDAEKALQLTFPILFELGDDERSGVMAMPDGRAMETTPYPHGHPTAPRSDVRAEMMAWSPWNADAALSRDSGTRPNAPRIPNGEDQWQVRVEMTLDDAEALVEGLCALIALAKGEAARLPATPPAALGFAGTKIGADYKASPPRYSSAQLEILSRKPVKRSLGLGQDGRITHRLYAAATMEKTLNS